MAMTLVGMSTLANGVYGNPIKENKPFWKFWRRAKRTWYSSMQEMVMAELTEDASLLDNLKFTELKGSQFKFIYQDIYGDLN